MTSTRSARVAYISSSSLLRSADLLPSNRGRASLVHQLVKSFNLLPRDADDDDEDDAAEKQPCKIVDNDTRLRHVDSTAATRQELLEYHDEEFLDTLLGVDIDRRESDEDSESSSSPAPLRHFGFSENGESERPPKRQKLDHDEAEDQERDAYGLEDDCPRFSGMREYVLEVAGASLCAARELRDDRADIAIAWTGGRHHAKRGEANGFCYVNDIVLAILELKRPRPSPHKRLDRILYLDIDLHHGDGVAVAFTSTPSVLTLSLHLFAPLFFPSTGSLDSTGPPAPSPAAYHDLNLAAHEGLSTESLLRLFDSSIMPIVELYDPGAIVMQLGCDGLAEDPCREWNLSLEGLGECVRRICDWRRRSGGKLMMLGGGGYHHGNAARCWTYLTSVAMDRPLPLTSSIPPSIDSYAQFSPSFILDVPAGNRIDKNTDEKLQLVETTFAVYRSKLEEKYRARKGEQVVDGIDEIVE